MHETQKINLHQQRSFSEKINATFEFIRQNFKSLFKCLIYIAGPPLLIVGIYSGVVQSSISLTSMMDESDPFAGVFAMYSRMMPVFVLFFLTNALVIAALYEYMTLYKTNTPEQITPGMVWNEIKKDYFQLLLAVFVISIIVSFGFLFFIIPGFFLGAALSLIFIIIVYEQKGFGHAFQRSFQLTSGNYLSSIGLLFVMTILYFLIALLFSLPGTILGGIEGFLLATDDVSLRDSSLAFKILFILAQVLNTIGTQLASTVILIAIGFQYFNLLEKKEAAGLMESIHTIGEHRKLGDEGETY